MKICKWAFQQDAVVDRGSTWLLKLMQLLSIPFSPNEIRIDRPGGGGNTIPLADGCKKRVGFISAYIPSETDFNPPTKELEETVIRYRGKRTPIIIGCDANSHHVAWGSTNTNKKGELLIEFIASNNLEIMNIGNVNTFVTKSRQEVLDITLATEDIFHYVKEWRVDQDDSFSDHRRIIFHIDCIVEKALFRNARKTDWGKFASIVSKHSSNRFCYSNLEELEEGARELERVLSDAYNIACPLREIMPGKGKPWWSKELNKIRKKARRALRVALKKDNDDSWRAYRETHLRHISQQDRMAYFRKCCKQHTNI
ncbi:uncharacterized protein LOC120636403 isoform X3 [Pararge aegeria]|uniref:uncharacterized protein LOC120636403 isoform X3 n=1 Tax=Pararge aegeria TaxID=116150 RepID=UPI0019D11FF0|nr:uncharacterized protein LOC120636403 isoform X3 [Pararge aegeria]